MTEAIAGAIQADNLSCAIGGVDILTDISLALEEGEFVALVGPNGAGKTTLLRCLAGLLDSRGTVSVGGRKLSSLSALDRAQRIAFLPQGHVFHWPLTAIDIVGLGRLPWSHGADLSDADRDAVAAAMAMTGLRELADRTVTSLSGGERARVALARVLATGAPVLLADEPTASLDPRYQLQIGEVLKHEAEKGGAVLAVLHDLGLAARFADRIAVIADGRLAGIGVPTEVLTPELLAETFQVDIEMVTLNGTPVPVVKGSLAVETEKRG